MRKAAAFMVVLLVAVASVAIAGEMKEKGKTHEVATVVVSVDVEGKTLTIKGDEGDMQVPVMGEAVSSLKDLKQGDKVTVTCQDDAEGHHQGVIKITKAAA